MGYDPSQERDSHGRWMLGGKSIPRLMYHITTPDRVDQIHREGLRPGSLQTSNMAHDISQNGVYLSSDWEGIVNDEVAFGDVTRHHDTLHVIAVDVGGLLGNHNARHDDEFTDDDAVHPIIANTEIPPNRIRDSFQIRKTSARRSYGPVFERVKISSSDQMSNSEKKFFLK